jgi:hypothetical protein
VTTVFEFGRVNGGLRLQGHAVCSFVNEVLARTLDSTTTMMNTSRPSVELLEDRSVPSATQYINALYLDFLNRTPSTAEVQIYLNQLAQGKTAYQIAFQFANSDEYFIDQTRTNYATFLGRTASDAEFTFWLTQRHNGMTDLQEQAAFLASNEFFALQNSSTSGWVTAVFQITLKRSPDPTSLSFFAGTAAQSLQKAATDIVMSPEGLNDAVGTAYSHFLNRLADPSGSSFFTQQLEATQSETMMLASLTSSQEYINNKAGGNLFVP